MTKLDCPQTKTLLHSNSQRWVSLTFSHQSHHMNLLPLNENCEPNAFYEYLGYQIHFRAQWHQDFNINLSKLTMDLNPMKNRLPQYNDSKQHQLKHATFHCLSHLIWELIHEFLSWQEFTLSVDFLLIHSLFLPPVLDREKYKIHRALFIDAPCYLLNLMIIK